MRGLDEIKAMNDRAAGREAGHADTDGDDRLASAIMWTVYTETPDPDWFNTGYLNGRSDG